MMRQVLFGLSALALVGCATSPVDGDGLRLLAPSAPGPVYESSMAPGTHDEAVAMAAGYAEQEYFLSGVANIYGYDGDGRSIVVTPDVPFTTRLLVVRPSQTARFSGNVIIAPFHPARGSNFWQSVRDYVLREGDIYVGVFVGTDERSRAVTAEAGTPSDGLTMTLASAPERYAQMAWPQDDGIRWDVFGQTARLLRGDSAENPLRDVEVSRMYAVGWSFTGSFLRTYINEGFHDHYRRADGEPAIDGYLVGISQHNFASGYVPISAATPILPGDDPRRAPHAIDVPVIELMSESEAITRVGARATDSDPVAGGRRIYETPGVTHGDRLRDAPAPSECPFATTDVPFRLLAWAALDNLDAWLRTGVAPPRQPTDMVIVDGRAARDANGNAAGGVRPAEIDVPLARYGETGDARCASRSPNYLEMRRVPFTRAELAALYPGGEAEYLDRFERRLDQLIADRWLLPEDRQSEIDHARSMAAAAFR